MRFLTLPLLVCVAAAIAPAQNYFSTFCESSGATAMVCSVQQPATGSLRKLVFVGASVYSSEAGTFIFSRGGTLGTPVSNTVVAVPDDSGTSRTAAFKSATVSGNTVVNKYPLVAGGLSGLDMKWFRLSKTAGSNAHFSISGLTAATVTVFMLWLEE